MAAYTANVLNTGTTETPTNLVATLSTMFPSTFYTAVSTLSANNFAIVPALSASYTSPILKTTNITGTSYTEIVSNMATASAVDKIVYNTWTFFTTAANIAHVVLDSAGTTTDGKSVIGIAYTKVADTVSAIANSVATLTAAYGTRFRVNTVYNGTQMALILSDASTTEFTCTTSFGLTTRQNLSTNSFTRDSVPNARRKWNLFG
jgi:hypothetical protein